MARRPRRLRPFITRSELLATVFFAIVVLWLAMIAVGMGV